MAKFLPCYGRQRQLSSDCLVVANRGTNRSRKENGKMIWFMAGIFVGGIVLRDNLLTATTFSFDGIISPFTDPPDIDDQWITSFEEVSEQLGIHPIEHFANTSHLPAQISSLPTEEITNSTPSSFLSPCPAQSSRSQRESDLPELHFVHIRKTGGTAVESAFLEAGLDPYKLSYSVRLNRTALEEKRKPGNREHIPPRYWRNRQRLGNVHLFAIVRNPYDRAISEYYQHFKSGFHQPPPNTSVNDANFLNHFIQSHFRRSAGDLFIPQYEYIFDAEGNRIVDHILHFDSIREEFPQLMECYGLNISFPTEPVNRRQNGASLRMTDLTAESIALINEVERISFETFGFEMLSINSSAKIS